MKNGWTLLLAAMFVMGGCATKEMATNRTFSEVVKGNGVESIALVPLQNYTDVPEAGFRAYNLVAGLLRAKNLKVYEIPKKKKVNEICKVAQKHGVRFVMYGGVSEWRYKTGIDGEPAVSLRLSLKDCRNGQVVWSGTGSSSDIWRASVGTTAQSVIGQLLE